MNFHSFGDLARTFQLRQQTITAQKTLNRLAQEVTTGSTTDPGKHLKGDFTTLETVESKLSRLSAVRNSTTEVTQLLSAMQSTFERTSHAGTAALDSLRPAANWAHSPEITVAGAQAMASLEATHDALNAQIAGRSLFSGAASDRPALAPLGDILSALDQAIAGETTAKGVATAIEDWFMAPDGGYETVGYLGDTESAGLFRLGGTETISLGVNGTDMALRRTLAGLAMGAILDRGVLEGNTRERAQIAGHAADLLTAAQSDMVVLAARVGLAEARVEASATRTSAEIRGLEIARTNMLSVDTFAAATELELARVQLESIFTITARLSRLSLSEFIR